MDNLEILIHKTEPLSDELQAYLHRGDFATLRHPLVYGVPYIEALNAMYNQQLIQKKIGIKAANIENNHYSYVYLHERPYRLEAFLGLESKLEDNQYWELLADVYTDQETFYANYDVWDDLLCVERDDPQAFMSREEQLVFDLLPEILTVYRGVDEKNRELGFAWSLKKETATWFAKRHTQAGRLITATIKKSNVLGYKNTRNEEEIVVTNPLFLSFDERAI
jgi:hypothetical protein